MRGQWLGTYDGTNTGGIVVNVDEVADCFQGVAYLHPTAGVAAGALFVTPDKRREFTIEVPVLPVDPRNGRLTTWEMVKPQLAPDLVVPSTANIVGTWGEKQLCLEWTTDIGTNGKCVLDASRASEPSELIPLTKNWTDFRSYVNTLERGRNLFRGQIKPWRLRTAFHRTRRADLGRFLTDVTDAHRTLSALTQHFFDLRVPEQNGAFINLIQHHGYPTPILDWTHSPYVAAFFAYRGITPQEAESAPADRVVRIHILNQSVWRQFPQVQELLTAALHFSLSDFIAVNNKRMFPQQSASSVTNVDDIETYIRELEVKSGMTCLTALDLPVGERSLVLRELEYMGITAGSLFPGLDGACEALKERHYWN